MNYAPMKNQVLGFTVADLEIEGAQVEQFMRETIVHVAEPGTPGD